MTRLIQFLLPILISYTAFSQQEYLGPPEYDVIKSNIFDNSSPYFYPNLYNRYLEADTSLTNKDFRYLYYGYTFQSKYIPNQESKYESQMMAYLRKGRLSSTELDEFIKIAELKLKELPFDIRTLNILAFSYLQKDDNLRSAQYKFKKEMLVKAILSTGNGKSEQSAYHVIDPNHERDILSELGLKFAASTNQANALCDYLVVHPNEKNIRGIYFDVSRLLKVRIERQRN
jgi:hypothetical protein